MEDFQVEFLNFDETPEEKYLGVASLKFSERSFCALKFRGPKTETGCSLLFPAIEKPTRWESNGVNGSCWIHQARRKLLRI